MTNPTLSQPVSVDEHIAPAPRVSVQAFCETVETAAAVQTAGEDRRLVKAHLKLQMGGIGAALGAYSNAPTPNVIIIESESRGADLLGGLDSLAEVCDAGTRVVVIGRYNDVLLYRALLRRGISDYLISPVSPIDVVRSICGLFSAADARPVGRIVAVIGARGGVGASTIAHNVAWSIAHDLNLDTVVADLDLAFGTAGLDFNQDPAQGIADAVFSPDRVDTAFVDRLLSKCTDRLSLLAAPATLDRTCDFAGEAFDAVYDALRATIPCTVLDVPHQWTGWTKRALVGADDILVVEHRTSQTCATPRTCSTCCVPPVPTTAAPPTASTRLGYQNSRKSSRRTSPKRSMTRRSPPSRSSRRFLAPPPITDR